MSSIEVKLPPTNTEPDCKASVTADALARTTPPRSRRILPVLITGAALALAVGLGRATWDAYMGAPWTRDGTVRAYVVTMAPEVAGRIVELPVADNQFVHKGDLLMVVDRTNFVIAVSLAQAALEQAKAVAQNARVEAERRRKLTNLSVSREEQQTFASTALGADAAYQQAVANLSQARVNLDRTRVVAPVNGYVTNLAVQVGDFVNVGERTISVVNSDSFWIDGYFEETSLEDVRDGDPVTIKLMGYKEEIHGHVDSLARGITVANARSDSTGLATVNPIFTWVRLAQRIPVRIDIDRAPGEVRLAAGMTATVQIDPRH